MTKQLKCVIYAKTSSIAEMNDHFQAHGGHHDPLLLYLHIFIFYIFRHIQLHLMTYFHNPINPDG